MTIAYSYKSSLYLNITNRCPNSCSFCVRNEKDALGDADSLWLRREPDISEIVDELERAGAAGFDEIVFCGYGEPTERMEDVLTIAGHIHRVYGKAVRLNTNGLANLINDRDVVPSMEGRIDRVSISLNAPNAERYMEICNPRFGIGSYEALLSFIRECIETIRDVTVTIVSGPLTQAEEYECERIAASLGARFLVR